MQHTPRRWLILSHAFNMDGRAASHTITDKIPHLLEAGIQPVVLSARTGRLDEHLEHYQLFPVGPVGLRFDLRHVLRLKWGKDARYRLTTLLATLLLSPGIVLEKLFWPLESQWSWWWPAYRKGLDLIRSGHFEAIYSTGGAYAAHMAGYHLKQKTGLPWIAEVHDPLVAPGRDPANAQERMQARIEELICKHADLPFWFTEQALASALQRHPEMENRGRMILPGGDAPTVTLPDYAPSEELVIGHFGSLSPTRHLGGVIEALARLAKDNPETAGKIELHIYGTDLDPLTEAARQRFGNDIKVRHFGRLERDPVTGKSGRQQVLERMHTVDLLLLHHGVEPACREYIPSKLYEYLWMKRPILGLIHENPQLTNLLTGAGHEAVPASDLNAQVQALDRYFKRWRTDGLPSLNRENPYSTRSAVQHLLRYFQEAIAASPKS